MDRPRPLDHGDPRTPMAWQHRNINYHQQYHLAAVSTADLQYPYTGTGEDQMMEEMFMGNGGPQYHPRLRTRPRPRPRPTSPSSNTSATSTSTGLDSDSQAKCEVNLPLRDMRPAGPLGTLRSVQSTLSTWDGEPCPVHHMAVPVPVNLLLPPPPPPPQLYPLVALPPPPPAVLLPPMLRPRPIVLAAEGPAPPEPLPVRDPKVSVSPLPPKEALNQSKHIRCCKGNIVVFWIILGIILVGILLGVILRFVTA